MYGLFGRPAENKLINVDTRRRMISNYMLRGKFEITVNGVFHKKKKKYQNLRQPQRITIYLYNDTFIMALSKSHRHIYAIYCYLSLEKCSTLATLYIFHQILKTIQSKTSAIGG